MIDNGTLFKISQDFGTECFVFDADEVRKRAKEIKALLNEGLAKERAINLCFSIKANPFLIPVLMDSVDYFEVCSPGELSICMAERVAPDKIIYSGVHKDEWDVEEAVKYGAKIITAESILHYEIIKKVCGRLKKSANVILRLSAGSQFGMSKEDIEYILEDAVKEGKSYVNLEGVHYFAGTQREKLKHQRRELEMLKEFMLELRNKYKMPLKWLEYGPGLPFNYFEGEIREDTLMPLKELLGDIKACTDENDITIEMGRFLASSCGYYLTRIYDIKRSFDNNWCILGGGINHVNYLGQMMGLKVPVIKFLSEDGADAAEEFSYTLCGSLCTTSDVLVREIKHKELKVGDILCFTNIGAYSVTEGINLFLSRTMPKIIIFNSGKAEPVRDRIESWKLNH